MNDDKVIVVVDAPNAVAVLHDLIDQLHDVSSVLWSSPIAGDQPQCLTSPFGGRASDDVT